MSKVQRWTKATGQKIALIFEGRDAAGKGGTIKRFTEHLNPRGARVVALEKPNDTERGQWFFQRYISQLPTAGEIVFFDRSWYNRAGVEPVMGFCTPDDYQRFIHQVSGLEHALIDSGLRLFKLWFDVGQQEQRRRIMSRGKDPLKLWKLSPMDQESMQRWDDYTRARDGMFLFTDTKLAPWTVVRSDDKRRARLEAMRYVLHGLSYPDKNKKVVKQPDPLIVGKAAKMFPARSGSCSKAQIDFRVCLKPEARAKLVGRFNERRDAAPAQTHLEAGDLPELRSAWSGLPTRKIQARSTSEWTRRNQSFNGKP